MDKRRLAIILAFLFLVQGTAFTQDLLPGTISIEPTSKVSLNKPEISILKKDVIYSISMGLLIYWLDAIKRYPKDVVKEKITGQYDKVNVGFSGVNFDLENIDYFKQEGFTRYYPFYVNGKPFIIRIFLTDEKSKSYQPDVEVLDEGSIENPPVTFQILEGVNAILKSCELKPQEMPSRSISEIYP